MTCALQINCKEIANSYNVDHFVYSFFNLNEVVKTVISASGVYYILHQL